MKNMKENKRVIVLFILMLLAVISVLVLDTYENAELLPEEEIKIEMIKTE